MLLNFLSDFKSFQNSVGIPFFLLVISAFVFRGTGDYSILFISYGVMLVAMIGSITFSWHQKTIQCSILTLLLIIWLIWIILPPLIGWVPNTAFFGIFQCSAWVFGFVLFHGNPFSEWLWNNLLRLLWTLALVCAAYALIQLFVRNAMPTGFFASKNTAAAFLMTVNLLLMGKLFILNHPEFIATNSSKSQRTIKKTILLISIYIISLALFAALSRGVILCFIFFTLLEIILCRHELRIKNVYHLAGVLALALATLCLFAQPAIHHRLALLAHEKSRLIIWQGAWHLWQKTPWYGLGIFNFKHYYPAFSLPGDGSNLEYVHNDLLQLFIETGIPGSMILLGIIVTLAVYLRRYLNTPSQNPMAHIQCMACFAALGALTCHSIVDFNFYVFPMNLLMGCYFGYLYYFFRKEGHVRIYSFSFKNIWILRGGIIVFLFVISSYFIRFLILEYYIEKAETAIQAKQFNDALMTSNHALKSFPFVEVQSLKIDAYLQLIQQATSDHTRHYWVEKTKNAINKAIAMNPYFARSYFQMALLQSLVLNDDQEANAYFLKALKNNPHFCLARLTFARFLTEQNKLHSAQEILEAGLQYPISPQYIEIYLNYLAKLRFENGDQEGAKKVAQRLEHLILYNQDYSDLL
ncbi:O-antigen ligase family protein [Legionella tucsonensis]|uniref:O-Antigen ligase n=1 Tax=Legionella tucsonensis TaxID=40335 RepID=A0A0W0ZTS8_9GAMM|nr:O-antigen ligase family protein [Legionella tucsonensis]KTD72297.1 O-Antigen ligase [Legionella tucsonensis]